MKRLLLVVILPRLVVGIYDMKWFDLNSWRCPFYNDGRWGIDVTAGPGAPGGSWPQPLRNFYIFGAGVWIGTIVANDTLTTCGYNPNTGGTEMFPALCRYWRQTPLDSADRVYKYPGDWPPPAARFPMAPQQARSEMDLWMCFSDSEPGSHNAPGRPLGVDVYLTVYGFSDSFSRDMFILKYELVNASGSRRDEVYFGLVVDADIGNYADDMAGLILNRRFIVGTDTFWVKNTGFFYDYNNAENRSSTWESGTPGAVAIRLLHTPDSLNLTAFKQFSIEIDPVRDPEQYLTLKGYNYRTGEYEPYDSLDPAPGDKRALLAVGPFNLLADSVATFYFAVIASPYGAPGQGPQGRDTTELALRCWWAERLLARILGIEEAQEVGFKRWLTVYPNPCRLGTVMTVTGADGVRIYDLQGRLVKELSGSDSRWDGRDRQGRLVSAGVYFFRPVKNRTEVSKVLLVQE
ncbi:MAG: T9SS type A sorting domain-containing protein [candidate division WOR-3 bacterium]